MTATFENFLPTLPPRYQIREILKESAETIVYRVYDLAHEREEAIKILRNAIADPQQLLRFKTEFATLASLEHPSIICVYDFDLLPGEIPYFTMEWFAGRKISDFFDGGNWDELYDVILQIASALHHVHSQGIIHLDIKPSNVLVSAEGRAKLMDFGLAINSRQVFDRRIRGTFNYMAPEVLRQDRIDSRADLYALGMMLYETVTGALPGYGRPAIDVMRMHLDEEIRHARSINPRVPEALDAIIMMLLEKDPRDRYQSAAALVEAVSRVAADTSTAVELVPSGGELFAAPLIGRNSEVAQLMELITAARDGIGNGAIVAGAEGMGKKRIVRDATLRAQLEGARVFSGRCPVNRKTIYAPFFEIFRQLITAVNPEADVGEEIRRMLRPVIGPASGEAGPPQHGQKYRLYNRIVQSMQDIYGFLRAGSETSGSPLILVVEDLQWADPSTADLFSYLIGEAKHNSLLVLGTLTFEAGGEAAIDSPSPGISFWEQRARELAFPIIRVGTLSEQLVREHVEALLGEKALPDEFVRWMLWESSGSPLNIRRIIDYLVTHTYIEWTSAGWRVDLQRLHSLRIPGGGASLLMERVDHLEEKQREILELAAVFGEVIRLDLLLSASGYEFETGYALIRALDSDGLLDEHSDGGSVRFPQIHFRDAVYNAIGDRRRNELHLRAANALEPLFTAGAAQFVGQLAYHFARANDTERGIRYSIEAGDVATRTLAHEEATDFYRSALELMDLAGVDEPRKSNVREKLADSYYRRDDYRSSVHAFQFLLKSIQTRGHDADTNLDVARVMKKIGKVLSKRGDQDTALTYFQNALSIYEQAGDVLDVAELLNRIAWLHREKDDLDTARAFAERAGALLESGEATAVYGYVKNMLGIIELARGNWQNAREILLEAITIGEITGSDQLCKVASTNLANTLWKLGEWDTALQYFRRNLEISEAEGDLWDLVTAYNNVGVVEYGRGNFATAAEYFDKSVRIDEKIGAVEYEALAQENLGDALEMLGRWDEALEHYQRCLSLEGFDESRASRISVYVPMARLMMKRGDLARALEYGQKALHAGERARDEDLVAEAAYVLALLERERENEEPAGQYLQRALSIFESNQTVQGLARANVLAANLALRAQRVDDARSHLDKASEIAGRLGDRFTLANCEWAWGKILSFANDREGAAERFESARQTFEELGTPYELARLQFDIGLLREEPEEATQTIRNAIRIFERLDARHDLERARGALFRIRPTGKNPEHGVVGLYEIVKIINTTLDLDEVLNRVLDVAIRRLRAERGMIMLLDPITSALRTRISRNIHEGPEAKSKRSPQSIVKEVMQTGHSVISADARADERFVESESVIAENILSIVCVPLIIRESIAGAIYVDHRQARHLFSQRDLSFLEAFADQAAIAIENARLYQELEEARTRLSLENESLRREVLVEKHLDSVVGQSDVVAKIQFSVRKAASGNSTVLLRGESGTGKGLVARIIHNISSRRQGPFIKFNCAALPETLAESELFGHEKGAFTGADRRKLGRFELANGGTIFIDEIGKLSLAMQAKLLRVVEDKEFERVGGTQTIKTDAKIITATNLDIEKAIEEGTFREDLFYRLNIIPLMLPPLRDRKDDIPVLAEHFIRKISRDLGVETKRLEPGVLELFQSYNWPGNVRELEATIHRAIVMSNDQIMTRHEFPALYVGLKGGVVPEGPIPPPNALMGAAIARMEITGELYEEVTSAIDRQLIVRALENSGGRIREAARRLGLARNTLKAKIQKYNIPAKGD